MLKFSCLAIENAIKNNNEKKKGAKFKYLAPLVYNESITDIRVSIWLINLTHAETSYRI